VDKDWESMVAIGNPRNRHALDNSISVKCVDTNDEDSTALDVFDSIGDEMDDFDADDENNCSSHNNN
jgi:hypothetical protein